MPSISKMTTVLKRELTDADLREAVARVQSIGHGESGGNGDVGLVTAASGLDLPVEILDLILTRLDHGSPTTLHDYYHLLKATDHVLPVLAAQIRDRVAVYKIGGLNGVRSEITNRLMSLENYLNVQNTRQFPNYKHFLLLIEDSLENLGNRTLELPDINLEGVQTTLVYHVQDADVSLVQLSSWLSTHLPGLNQQIDHLMVETDTSVLQYSQDLFGILSPDFYTSSEPLFPCISFPNIDELGLNYMALDSFIYKTFLVTKNVRNNYIQIKDAKSVLRQYLDKVRLSFPELTTMKFVDSRKGFTETCNFIDLSSLTLTKFLDERIDIMKLFKIHSLTNWDMPQIRSFSGHRLKFDESPMSGSPERCLLTLKENIRLLQKLAMSQRNDGLSHFNVSLIPHGVQQTKILNWIPIDNGTVCPNTEIEHLTANRSPMIFLSCNSLKKLDLGILKMETSTKLQIQGLYLPNLEELSLTCKSPNVTSSRRSSFDGNSDEETMTSMLFTSWNDLSRCKQLEFIHSDPGNITTIFSIENLKRNLPNLDMSRSFPTFVDEKQRFVVA